MCRQDKKYSLPSLKEKKNQKKKSINKTNNNKKQAQLNVNYQMFIHIN